MSSFLLRNSGSHPVYIFAVLKHRIMSIDDLVFSPIGFPQKGSISQAIVRFENNLGLSVLCGPGTLTSPERPYEAAVISFSSDGSYTIIYPDFTHNDVLTYLTDEQVTEYMRKVSEGTGIVSSGL